MDRYRRFFGPYAASALAGGLVVAFLTAPACVAAQRASNGPLTHEEGAPLQRISYTPVMEAAAPLSAGRLATGIWLGYSNVFEQDSTDTHVLFLDLERLLTAVTVRWGATSRLELGGRIAFESTGPGALDDFILDWHELWGFGQANRDRFPQGRYAQRLRDGDETPVIDVPQRAFGFHDARLFAKVAVATSADSADVLALRIEGRLPGNANRVAASKSDLAVAALGRAAAGSWFLHAMMGVSTLRAPPVLAPYTRGRSFYLALAAERPFGSWSFVTQLQGQSAALDGFEHREVDRAPTNLVLGVSGRVGDGWAWDVSFQEDIPADTPAIDFTLGVRVSRVW